MSGQIYDAYEKARRAGQSSAQAWQTATGSSGSSNAAGSSGSSNSFSDSRSSDSSSADPLIGGYVDESQLDAVGKAGEIVEQKDQPSEQKTADTGYDTRDPNVLFGLQLEDAAKFKERAQEKLRQAGLTTDGGNARQTGSTELTGPEMLQQYPELNSGTPTGMPYSDAWLAQQQSGYVDQATLEPLVGQLWQNYQSPWNADTISQADAIIEQIQKRNESKPITEQTRPSGVEGILADQEAQQEASILQQFIPTLDASTRARYSPDFEDYVRQGEAIAGDGSNGYTVRGNKVAFADQNRAAIEQEYSSPSIFHRYQGTNNLWHMTQDERDHYHYLLAKNGEDSADNYLSSLEDELNLRAAQGTAKSIAADEGASRVAREMAASFVGDNSGGLANLGQIFTPGSARATTEDEYLAALVQQDIQNRTGSNLSLEALASSASGAMGSMLPSLAVGALNPLAGAATMGAQTAGGTYGELLKAGYSPDKAAAEAIAEGVVAGGSQYIFGGISKLGGRATGATTDAVLSRINNGFLRGAASLGISITGEEIQELAENKTVAMLRNAILEEDNPLGWSDEDWETLAVTAITTALLESPGAVSAGLSRPDAQTGIDTTPNAQNATEGSSAALNQQALIAMQDILDKGRINNTVANEIINNPTLSAAFTQLTGVELTGTTQQRREAIQGAHRSLSQQQAQAQSLANEQAQAVEQMRGATLENDAQTQAQAAQAQAQAQAEAIAQTRTQANEAAVRESGYASYLRGMAREGISYAQAGEILSDPALKAAWEQLTGITLPASNNRAREIIRQSSDTILAATETLPDVPYTPPTEQSGMDMLQNYPESVNAQPQAAAPQAQPQATPAVEQNGMEMLENYPATAAPDTAVAQPGTSVVRPQRREQQPAQTTDRSGVDMLTDYGTDIAAEAQAVADTTAQAQAQPQTQPPQAVPQAQPVDSTTDGRLNGSGPERERGFSRNVATDNAMEQELRQVFRDDPEMYTQLTNNETLARAQAIYDQGLNEAISQLDKALGEAQSGSKLPVEMIPLSRMVANELTRQGDVKRAAQIEADIAAELTYNGRGIQAARILRNSDPAAKVSYIDNLIAKLNSELTRGQRGKNVKRDRGDAEGNIVVDPELIASYANAPDEATANAAIDAICQSIAEQSPATLYEKWTALRYLSMLGNLKTQGRNVIGNAFMTAETFAKRRLQAGIEGTLHALSGGKYERNMSMGIDRGLYKAGLEDANAIMDTLKGEAKYPEINGVNIRQIQDKRSVFDFRIIEAWRKATNKAMDVGDVIFLRFHYADSFQGFLKAHGVTDINNASPDLINRAREFAIKEAQQATFRDPNAFSDAVSRFGRGPKVGKVGRMISEGLLPFRKTPANVFVRGVEYSPLGVAETLYTAVQAAQGKVEAADVVNSLSKNLTGTALAAAGYYLAAAGMATGGGSDDEELASFLENTGYQDYSLKIGDQYVSITQFSPAAVPLLMGVELYANMQRDITTTDDLAKIGAAMSAPMLEMSFLNGLDDSLSVLTEYGENPNAINRFFVQAATSYLSQLIPSVLRQAEQAFETTRQTLYADPDSKLGSNLQYQLARAAAGIPGIDYNQQDYVDVWGRTHSTGNLQERLFDSFLNPTYTSQANMTDVDIELARLHSENKDVAGFPDVLPDKAYRSMEYTEDTHMTAEEYKRYSQIRGQISYGLVDDFMSSNEYQYMDDESRAAVIFNLYSLAADRALKDVQTNNGVEYTGGKDEIANLSNIPAYMSYKEVMGNAGNKDNNRANADWGGLDQLMSTFTSLPDDVKDKLKGSSNLHAKALEYANSQGIGAYDWYKMYDDIAESEKELGSEAYVVAALQANFMNGTDEEKLSMLRSQLPLSKDGSIPTIVRRYEAALSSGVPYDLWTQVEITLKDKDESSAWGVRAAAQSVGLNENVAQAIYKKLSKDEAYARQLDTEFLELNPLVIDTTVYKTFREKYDELAKANSGTYG